MASESFAIANRALRLKRRSFSKEIMDLLKDAWSDEGLSREAFNDIYPKKWVQLYPVLSFFPNSIISCMHNFMSWAIIPDVYPICALFRHIDLSSDPTP